jgi:hypothetical protein
MLGEDEDLLKDIASAMEPKTDARSSEDPII